MGTGTGTQFPSPSPLTPPRGRTGAPDSPCSLLMLLTKGLRSKAACCRPALGKSLLFFFNTAVSLERKKKEGGGELIALNYHKLHRISPRADFRCEGGGGEEEPRERLAFHAENSKISHDSASDNSSPAEALLSAFVITEGGGMREGLISPNLLQLPGVEQTLARPPGGHTRGLLSISSHGDPLSPLPAPQKNSSWMMWAGVGDVEVLRHLVTAPGVGRRTQPAPPVPRQPGKLHRKKVKNKK